MRRPIHRRVATRGAAAALLLALLLGLGAGCSNDKVVQHPEDVNRLMGDNPAPAQPVFDELSEEEQTGLVADYEMRPYRIGITDTLQVIGDTDFLQGFGETSKGDVIGTRVKSDGSIYLPVLGAVKAADLTPVELQADLRERLKKYKSDPFVSVDVLEFKSQRFYMMGALETPGVFSVNGTVTLLEGLSIAGAASSRDADLERAYLVRNSKILPISIGDMLLRGRTQKNLYLQHGDMVMVPHWDRRDVAYVLGEVKTPGPVSFTDGHLTLAGAIAAAGGVDPKTADQNVVKIYRGHWPNPRCHTLSTCDIYGSGESIYLHRGDRILVAPKQMATASRALELFQPFLNTAFQALVSASAVDNLRRR